MATKGFIIVPREVPSEIRIGETWHVLVKDRQLFSSQTYANGDTTKGHFVEAPGPANLDSYEKPKTLFAIPDASVIMGVKAYHRRALSVAEWITIYFGGAFKMEIQLGGEFINVDKGVLADIAGGGTQHPSGGVSSATAETVFNNSESDYRWYSVQENKTVPNGENFQFFVNYPTAIAGLASPVIMTINLFATEWKIATPKQIAAIEAKLARKAA